MEPEKPTINYLNNNVKAKNLEEKVVQAEATGKPVSIGKKLFNFAKKAVGTYQSLSPTTKALLAVGAVEGTRALLGTSAAQTAAQKIAEYGPQVMGAVGSTASAAYNKVKDYFKSSGTSVPKTLPSNSTALVRVNNSIAKSNNDSVSSSIMDGLKTFWPRFKGDLGIAKKKVSSWFKGNGYGGGRLRKGSPEAKAYMARLRAIRRAKLSGKGIIGLGFPAGVSPAQLKTALKTARELGQGTVTVGEKTMPYSAALKIHQGYTKMQNFWKTHNRKDFHKPKYSKKWKYMSEVRYAALLENLRKRMAAEMAGKWLVPQTSTAKRMR